MGQIVPTSNPPLAAGSTRSAQYELVTDDVSATIGVTGLNNKIRNIKGGIVETASLVIGGGNYDVYQGRLVVAIPAALNNGFAWVKGFPVTFTRPPLGSLAQYGQRVLRFMCSMAAPSNTPNADMGTEIILAGSSVGAVTDLYTSSGTGSSKSGFGVQMIGNLWQFTNKAQGLASSQFTELVPLGVVNLGQLIDVEFRIFDATAGQEARLDLYVQGTLKLQRYWTNPAGVSTPTLPAFNVTLSGAQLYMQHRNTSVATGAVYIADPRIIAGLNDSGTF